MSYLRMARESAAEHGVVTRRWARGVGLSDDQIDRAIDQGLVDVLHPGVFRHAAHPYTDMTRLHAAVRACGDGAIASHRSAARLHDLRDVPRFRPEVTVPHRHLPRLTGVLVHRTDTLDAVDVVRIDRITTASVALTLLQLGAVLPRRMVVQAAQDAIIRRLVSEEDLICVLERLGRPGRRGTASLRHVLRGVPPQELQSRLELRLHTLLRACIAEPPVLQHPVELPGGRVAHLDFAWPARKLAVEADGRRWHSTTADFERDLVRSRALASLGWARYPFGWADIHQRRAAVQAELRALDRVAA